MSRGETTGTPTVASGNNTGIAVVSSGDKVGTPAVTPTAAMSTARDAESAAGAVSASARRISRDLTAASLANAWSEAKRTLPGSDAATSEAAAESVTVRDANVARVTESLAAALSTAAR